MVVLIKCRIIYTIYKKEIQSISNDRIIKIDGLKYKIIPIVITMSPLEVK